MTPRYIILHSAASRSPASPEIVDGWHREVGFRRHLSRPGTLRHIGYHFYIERSGVLTRCREENETGSHCRHAGMNHLSLGICLEGHGDHEVWAKAQIRALRALLCDLYPRHPLIAIGGTSRLIGHREVPGVAKTCPGALINMDDVRLWYERHVIADSVKPIDVLPLASMPDR